MLSNERLVEAHTKGFRVTDAGVAIKPDGSIQPVSLNNWGYWRFSIKNTDGKIRAIMVHRLMAFQKFGIRLFDPGIEVRHLNGPQDNRKESIEIGTKSQNMMDRDPAVRKAIAAGAARKLTDEQVRQLREERVGGAKYSDLAQRYSIRKSTVSYIVRGITCA